MCGISLLIDKSFAHVSDRYIKEMNNRVKHRGPDGEGYYFGDHFAMGHRALKITDFSSSASQPMQYEDYVIIHNGEIYNYCQIREQLKKEGYSFSTQSDTEVILAAYDKWGQKCTSLFMGMWAFALYDKKKKLIFCSRDRFGIKPFCFTTIGDLFVAGSEIKQFIAIPGFVPRLNNQVAFDYLYGGKIKETSVSFFEGVQYLQAGHQLVYDLNKHTYTIEKWYDFHAVEVKKNISFTDASAQFKDLFTESMLLHTHSSLPLAACLSGGLDSTSIVGIAKEIETQVDTFSTCIVQSPYNEIEYINEATLKYGFTNHKIYPVINDLGTNRLLRTIIYHQDQPILSGSFFSEFKVCESVAQNKMRILLSGQGADEYLGGYREFALLSLLTQLRKGRLGTFYESIINKAENKGKTVKEVIKDFLLFGLGAPITNKRIAKQRDASPHYQALNRSWLKECMASYKEEANIGDYQSLSDLSKAALNTYSLPHQLHSEDRNSMLHSVESRLPFLDHRLVEWCLSLPDDFIVRKGSTKAVLREGLKNVLPKNIYNRHSKLGFPGPEELLFTHHYHFIQQQFQEFAELYPGIFTPKLQEVHTAYFKNKIPYNNILFRALNFGTWARTFGIDNSEKFHTANQFADLSGSNQFLS